MGKPKLIWTRGDITSEAGNSRITVNKFFLSNTRKTDSEIFVSEETYVQNKPKSLNDKNHEPLNSLSWNDTGRTKERQFSYTATPGVKFNPVDATSPYCIFKQFFTDKIIDSIALATNCYSELFINSPYVQSRMKLFKRSLFSR